ncbi:hypothetical protein Ahy_B03g064122 [Arachis hypogaea]|uniref:Uncharacterized protein n=1 Tax=Arachis hypogaea TaxID=3818 RepID=A0A444ZYU3_ARAHY|nr:hypothetical protein Ahy_B03g064122 [Arachis hypogaea]
MTIAELQYGLCQSIESDILKRVATDDIQHDPDMQDDRVKVYERMDNDSKEEFEATYEASDEDEDGDGGGDTDHEDGDFKIRMEYSSRKSVIAAIRSYTISKGVDYVVYDFVPQTFYAKCKTYGRGCDWHIRASLIQKKDCWKIRRHNGRHTCSMGTISQDQSKLDSDTVAKAMNLLVESNPSIKMKSIIAEVQARFNYTISYQKAWLAKQKLIAKVFGSNILREFKVSYLQKLVVNIGYSKTVDEYNINYKRLQE